MKYLINRQFEINTDITLKEVAEKIKNKVIDLSDDNLIVWNNVWSVVQI